MKAPTSLLNRPGRLAAVGAVVAVSATALIGLVASSASAAEPGKCTENVNVRAEPDVTSRIVALCEAGTAVETGRTQDGFVELTNLRGWSAQEYISVDGAAPAAPATGRGESTSPNPDGPAPSDGDVSGEDSAESPAEGGGLDYDASEEGSNGGSADSGTADSDAPEEAAPAPSPLGGLIG